mmetsp:Transcript_13051/g.20257  ORF Transcript_13051/g.20257 Transcript_13051/m.20257 type:complete len:301 (+) Transcript_13051:631-1533(+)
MELDNDELDQDSADDRTKSDRLLVSHGLHHRCVRVVRKVVTAATEAELVVAARGLVFALLLLLPLLKLEGEVLTAEHGSNEVALDASVGLVVEESPVGVLLSQVAGSHMVFEHDNELDQQAEDEEPEGNRVVLLLLSEVEFGYQGKQCKELEVVGQVPSLLEAVRRLPPGEEVVQVNQVKEPRLAAAVLFFKLIESRAETSEEGNDFPEDQDHDEVLRGESDVSADDKLPGGDTLILLQHRGGLLEFEDAVAPYESSDPVEDVTLQVGLEDEREEVGVRPGLDRFNISNGPLEQEEEGVS